MHHVLNMVPVWSSGVPSAEMLKGTKLLQHTHGY